MVMAPALQSQLASADACAVMLQEFPWIATEKDFFGRPGSDYDFEARDVDAIFEEYEAANQSLQRLANKVNRKVPSSPAMLIPQTIVVYLHFGCSIVDGPLSQV